jgi:hypothetical protein
LIDPLREFPVCATSLIDCALTGSAKSSLALIVQVIDGMRPNSVAIVVITH